MLFRSQDLRRIVEAFGQQATLSPKRTGGTYSPATGGVTGGTNPVDIEVKVYLYDFNLSEIDGTNIIAGDRRCVVNTRDIHGDDTPEPEVGDQIQGVSDTVYVVSSSKIFSGEEAVAYMCQVRE